MLRPPNWDNLLILQVDVSDFGVGAILSQLDMEEQEHPIAFASRKLQPREMKLSTTEKECLAIVWTVEMFRYYLFGRKFKLQTDHNPLVWLNQIKNKNRKLLRWSLTLQEYDIELEHKIGEKHVNVDALIHSTSIGESFVSAAPSHIRSQEMYSCYFSVIFFKKKRKKHLR